MKTLKVTKTHVDYINDLLTKRLQDEKIPTMEKNVIFEIKEKLIPKI